MLKINNLSSSNSNEKDPGITFLQKIGELPDDETVIRSFVQDRISSFGKNTRREFSKNESIIDNPVLSGFIDKEFLIQPGVNQQVSFKLDDDEIYYKFILDIKGNRNKNLNEYQKALRSVQSVTSSYFGYLTPPQENVEIRDKKFDSPGPSYKHSISDNKEGALCTERAAVAHNLLIFCGEESYFVAGYMKEETPESETMELHNFLITKNPQGYYEVFDPTNPVRCFSNKQKDALVTFVPFLVNTKSTTLPKMGSSFSEDYFFKYKDENGVVKEEKTSQRTYQIGAFNFESD